METRFYKCGSKLDIEKLAKMAERIWHEHYDPLIGKPQVDYMLEKFQSTETMKKQIDDGYEYYLLFPFDRFAAAAPVGYFAFVRESGAIFLSKIYVEKEMRGKGFASAAVKYIAERCRMAGLPKIYLTVNRGNSDSVAAYEKLGFVKAEERRSDIGGDYYMDDFIMELFV